MKLDFGVVKSSPMYQNFNVLTYFHPGNNGQSVFHRYHGPVGRYLIHGDFDDVLLQTDSIEGSVAVKDPNKKITIFLSTKSLPDFQEFKIV